MQSLAPFNKVSIIKLLRTMLDIQYEESLDFYVKLFDQVKQKSVNINAALASKNLQLVKKYKETFPQAQATELGQFFIDRYYDAIQNLGNKVETDVILQILKDAKDLH